MTLYRVWWECLPNDDDLVDVVDAETLEHAFSIFAAETLEYEDSDGIEGFGGEEYTNVVYSQCVCSDNTLVFVNLKYPDYPGEWECPNCKIVFTTPPDEFSNFQWEAEKMFAEGYIPCPTCESYNENCRYCQGAGWYKPEDVKPARWDGVHCPDCGRHLGIHDGGEAYNYEAEVPMCEFCHIVYWDEWELADDRAM
jgi:hypothetical protein